MLPPTEPTIVLPKQDLTTEQEALARKISSRYDGLALGIGAVALLALSYFVESVLSPFVVMLAVYVLLGPFKEYRAARKMLAVSYLLFGLWFFVTLFGLLVPFLIGAVIAYLFNPLVTMLHDRWRWHRTWTALFLVLLLTALLVVIGWLFIPSIVVQTEAFIVKLTSYAKQHSNTLDPQHLRRILLSIGLPSSVSDQVVGQATPWIRSFFGKIPEVIFGMIAGLPKFLERTLNLIIVPIAAFYFLKDWLKIRKLVYDLLPTKNPARRDEIIQNIDHIIYAYVRGQATVAAIVGTLGAIAYSILGIPYAGLLGVILAVSDLIPIVGMIFSMFVVELVIFLTMELNFGVIASGVLVIVGLHFLEVYIMGPRIIGPGVGIPPILMILALLVFGYFLGFIGLLIAVPSTAVIILFIEEYRRNQVETEGTYAT